MSGLYGQEKGTEERMVETTDMAEMKIWLISVVKIKERVLSACPLREVKIPLSS